ncbi:hypothetical protein F0L17_20340 [Streptomyces sp. TRM43335]|uniref:EthD domain-containing protein n=1 Tax=Streptomyces taklimakanensis TaxID=2569853 RepID=A0A6G2BH71_9ACTN|nr:hypothetical protein [Streptomyces taklimakanensis]MTE21419.1 hypothetical protein [Streptomyces taklimakanensis]
MKPVNDHLAVKARLTTPNSSGYLLLAAEVGNWYGPFLPPDRTRRALLARLTTAAGRLAARDEVEEATVFRAVLRPPGEGRRLLRRRGVHPARYDVALLIRTVDPESADTLRKEAAYEEVLTMLGAGARRVHHVAARNAARIDDVDHRPDRLFLLNYFYADDEDDLMASWEYTAGWFQEKTDLPDSVLMRPLDGEPTDYGLINHASWPNFRSFLPDLALRPSFRRFVLATFEANDIAAQPIVYRRA